jgi:hypothetical protein
MGRRRPELAGAEELTQAQTKIYAGVLTRVKDPKSSAHGAQGASNDHKESGEGSFLTVTIDDRKELL